MKKNRDEMGRVILIKEIFANLQFDEICNPCSPEVGQTGSWILQYKIVENSRPSLAPYRQKAQTLFVLMLHLFVHYYTYTYTNAFSLLVRERICVNNQHKILSPRS